MLTFGNFSFLAPSYFSQYFRCQIASAQENGVDISSAIRTLYIDRDPGTFRDIALHLQGYHIQPRDGTHFVRLFADAQFYSCMFPLQLIPRGHQTLTLLNQVPKLMSQLYQESIFISIGHREFQIPRDVLTDPGNSPNYFSLGFGILFSSPHEVFPGLDREGLIRPPSILPPSVPNRSADTFAELLHLLQGYPVAVRNETHREELLRDARYFHFKGLEQRLIPHSITFNALRQRKEITLRLENVQKSGIRVAHDDAGDDEGDNAGSGNPHTPGWASYARPYVDDAPAELVLEIGDEATRLHFTEDGPRAEFFGDTRARVAKLLEVIATKLSLPPTTQPLGLLMASGGAGAQPPMPGNTSLSENLVRVSLDAETAIILDGSEHIYTSQDGVLGSSDGSNQPRKRKRADDASDGDSQAVGSAWTVRTGQWRLRIQLSTGHKSPLECVFVGVQLDAVTSELGRNKTRGFLKG